MISSTFYVSIHAMQLGSDLCQVTFQYPNASKRHIDGAAHRLLRRMAWVRRVDVVVLEGTPDNVHRLDAGKEITSTACRARGDSGVAA
jgi:hypothetical protein